MSTLNSENIGDVFDEKCFRSSMEFEFFLLNKFKQAILMLLVTIEDNNDIILHLMELFSEYDSRLSKLLIENNISLDPKIKELKEQILSLVGTIDKKQKEKMDALLSLEEVSISNAKKALQRIYERNILDKLTGLYNKSYVYKLLDYLMLENPQPFYFIFFDLNNLKTTNDTYGHQFGDVLIKTFAARLKKIFNDDVVARFHGDEFAVVSFEPEEEIKQKIEKLKKVCLSGIATSDENNNPLKIKVSFGAGYASSSEGELPRDIIRIADKRMYRDKYLFKNGD